jgi:purine-nucleoside phosphorylase
MAKADIREAADYIAARIGEAPRMALVLGSGLGGLADEIESPVALNYGDIPHFPSSTAPGHAGRLVAGVLAGKRVIAMQGRFHFYEGHPLERVVFPVRVFKALGVERLFLTNAAGGANPYFAPGDFMIIRDHVNLTGQNPCIGPNDESLGQRFFDMTKAYDPELRAIARAAGEELGIALHEGVYAWFTGPSFETPAEIRMARILGADAVGMSTVPEVIAAAHCGLKLLGLSCITNMAAGILDQPISGEEVLEVSAKKRPEFTALVRRIVELGA